MAIRGDLNSRMIESHRLMPITPAEAVFGYMLGGASQVLLLAALNFVIGAVLCAMGGLQTDRWILSTGVLLVFAVFVWSILAM